LSRKPHEITVYQIIMAAEGEMALVDCIKSGKGCKKECDMEAECVTQNVWREASKRLNDYLESVTLKDLCDDAQKMGVEKELDHRFMYFI
ncbi:MAG: Rrf2 family transcriptional regulator, partial [Desulfuromonadales bacterium]|nr:Rrf2 family transcriptional regulator [Desulfuromonadales bacterium]